ncbi:(R)-mandelonitrile beta-glucosyltransferase-like protein [Drosera capensis]
MGVSQKPHAVCIPFAAQGHVNPMLQLAKLLHHHGFHITFVNTIYNRNRLLKSRGSHALDGVPGFRFEAIPDGLPPSDEEDVTQFVPAICEFMNKTCLEPLVELVNEINCNNNDSPPVTCIVGDGVLSFTLRAGEVLGIPTVAFWTPSACGVLCYVLYKELRHRELFPLKDAGDLTNGYLETKVEGIPGMKNMRLKDFPSFLRTTDPNDFMYAFVEHETEATNAAAAIIINTFDSFEQDVLSALSSSLVPPIYSVGPLQLIVDNILDEKDPVKSLGSNLWAEEYACLEWLDKHEPGSVVYVNFGSVTVMTLKQLIEFAWGLANSKKPFLWIIRPDIVAGDSALVLPREFIDGTNDRGMLASWCPQDQVLKHSSVGVFLTHSGWNSTLESVIGGVPVISWPFFAEQQTNCRYSCVEWKIGLEIDNDVKRDEVEKLVREMIEAEKGKEMKKRAVEWKAKAETAAKKGGSSYENLSKLINEVLLA